MAALVVDGMNVIGSRPDGWWRDRDRAARRLLARLQAWAAETGDKVTLVLDGRPLDECPRESTRASRSSTRDASGVTRATTASSS